MSRERDLRLISLLEDLVDAMYGPSFEETNSLGGLIEGTAASIRSEFRAQ